MKLTTLFLAAILLASCSNSVKKIVIFGRGSIDVNPNAKTITVQDDGPAVDYTTEFRLPSALNLTIKKTSGDVPVTVAANGLYLVNAKKDTVIGSYQNYDAKRAAGKQISQDELKGMIDSLIQLTKNQNVSAANRNFFVLPFTAVKITDNADATIIPPFKQMPLVEQSGNKIPEVYRFYNISEIRETIAKLQELTVPQKKTKNTTTQTVVIKDKSEQF